MGLFGSLIQGVVNVAITPIAAAVDIVELGKNNRTAKQFERVGENIDDALESDSLL